MRSMMSWVGEIITENRQREFVQMILTVFKKKLAYIVNMLATCFICHKVKDNYFDMLCLF